MEKHYLVFQAVAQKFPTPGSLWSSGVISLLGPVHMERIFWWKRRSLVRLGRPSRRVWKCTFMKPGSRWKKRKTAQCVFMLGLCGCRLICFVWFELYYFCSFKYSPLVFITTNCTLKSIFCSIYKVYQLHSPPRLYACIERVDLMRIFRLVFFFFWWRASATQWPWMCTTAFLQLDAFLHWVQLNREIPETLPRKTGGKIYFSPVWTGP